MNWFKENPILSAILLLCLMIALSIGYFASEASTAYISANESLSSQVNTLSSLQKKSPSQDNLNIITDGTEKYADALDNLKTTLLNLDPALEPIKPGDFQDKLREGVNALTKTAKEKNIKLPEKFFFGFDEYQSQLPSPETAPALNREFQILQKLLQNLLGLPVESINLLERDAPTASVPTPTPTPPPSQNKSQPSSTPSSPPILSARFKLSFTASQEKTRSAINLIPKNEAFLIIRSLTMENTKPAAPSKKDPTIPSKDKSPTSLQVLLGNESVKSDLLLEIIDFPNVDPESPKKQ